MFDGVTIAALAKEFHNTLKEGRVQKIAQTEKDELILTVRNIENGMHRVFLSANASLPLCYLTEKNKPAPAVAPAFCMLLRKHLQNGRITGVDTPGLERILRFHIEHRNEMGDLVTHTLVIELMGKHSNIILLEKDIILDAIKRVSSMTSSVREVLPGREYFIPETRGKVDPLSETEDGFLQRLSGTENTPADFLQKSYQGISSEIAEEISFRAKTDDSQSGKDLSGEKKQALQDSFFGMMNDVREGRFTPTVYYDAEPVHYSAFSMRLFDGLSKNKFSSMSTLLESYYEERSASTRIRQKSADLRKVVQTILERNVHKYDLQAKQLSDTDKRERFRKYGELLKAYAYSIPQGGKEAEVEDYETGETVKIAMDETLSPMENANRYFSRYTKLKRTREALIPLMEEGKAKIEQLRGIQMALSIAETEGDLAEIREELAEGGFIKKHPSKNAGKVRKEKGTPLHYVTSDGYDVYVGKNNIQNDNLTFHFAMPGDIWFHANDMPGSHVILRAEGKEMEEIPDRVFEEAASLAAYYSSGKGDGKVEIDYAYRKEIKKPPGAAPGFVIYHTNYSILAKATLAGLQLKES